MLNGRDKIGTPNIDWQQHALGLGKNRRKTIGFGKFDRQSREHEDEIYIRELSIVDAGLGCALWDASIILARWIYGNPHVFWNRSVLELGSGCSLPAIMAARFASCTVVSDYIEQVLDNARYNISTNAKAERCESEKVSSDAALDVEGAAALRLGTINCNEMPAEMIRRSRRWWGQRLLERTAVVQLDWDRPPDGPLAPPHLAPFMSAADRYDVIIGSELTYSLLSVHSLPHIIVRFLDPSGVFVEVLSTDRDGVSAFVDEMALLGFSHETVPVPPPLMHSFNTKQRPELYDLHVWYYPHSRSAPFFS